MRPGNGSPPPVSPAPPLLGPGGAREYAPSAARTTSSPASPRSRWGPNNGVRLWVRGDGSGATLRVHLIAAGPDASPADAARGAPRLAVRPHPRHLVRLARDRAPRDSSPCVTPTRATMLDAALPGDAQPDGAEAAAPDWAAINAIALETGVPKRAALGLDDIAWATLGADGTETAVRPWTTLRPATSPPGSPWGPPTRRRPGLRPRHHPGAGPRRARRLGPDRHGPRHRPAGRPAVRQAPPARDREAVPRLDARHRFDPILPGPCRPPGARTPT